MISARAVWITQPGDPEVLTLREVEVREPGYGEVAVDVAAAGLNRADLLQRRGVYGPPAGFSAEIPGLEFAGTVSRLGPGATRFEVGDRVMGVVAGGAMCTAVVAHERELVRVPRSMSLVDAAAIPEAFFTAYDAMVLQGGLSVGEVALVHAAASGVGTAAMQIARAVGATPLGTVRTPAKQKRLQDMGFDVILAEGDAFAEAVRRHTEGRGAELCLDGVGGPYIPESIRALALRGRIVAIGTVGGVLSELPLALLLRQRATLIGSVLRSRPLEEKIALAQRFSRALLPRFVDRALRPVVDATMPMRDIVEAHRRMERNETFGKLVLTWQPESPTPESN
ncbi:MAG: NAD(P)H-quinone oxidoreductase [Polyangiales bacterium]